MTVGERRILDDEDWQATVADLRDLFNNYTPVRPDFYVARAISLITGHYERRGMLSPKPNTESDKSIDEYLKPFHQTGCPFSKKYGKCVNADCEHKIRDLKSNLYSLLMDVIGEDDIQKPNDEDYQEWLVCDTCEVIIDPELKTYECNCKLLNNLRQTQRTKLKELFNVEEK